ncbi:hypothetical protein AC480_04150 [miscellaneous Crenarchaeota group archaeon SMTZ1-55]|nr:MAG: hypothetical protein AC480_04150 [miscellaneous Crenarchaeota group archaeon SMTZ1-55]
MTLVNLRPERLIPALKRLTSGSLSLKARDTAIVTVSAAANEIIMDFQNLEVVKELLEPFGTPGILSALGAEEMSVVDKLTRIKGFAEALRAERMTISLRRRGEPIVVLGERANPRLSRLVLGSSIQADILQILSTMRALR